MLKKYILSLVCFLFIFRLNASLPFTNPSTALAVIQTKDFKGVSAGTAAIAAGVTLGYVIGSQGARIFDRRMRPDLAGAIGATMVGAVSACTVAPYMAYKKGNVEGLVAYCATLVLVMSVNHGS